MLVNHVLKLEHKPTFVQIHSKNGQNAHLQCVVNSLVSFHKVSLPLNCELKYVMHTFFNPLLLTLSF